MLHQCQSASAQNFKAVFTTSNSALISNKIQALEKGNNNALWIGTDAGLHFLQDGNWTSFNTQNSNLSDDDIRSIEQISNGHLMIGTFTGGLCILNNDFSINCYTPQNSDIPDAFIKDILQVNDSLIYLASPGGLTEWNINSTQSITWNSSNSNFPSSSFTGLALDLDGRIIAGTINGGLVIKDGDQFTSFFGAEDQLPDNTILDIVTENYNIWMATPAAGLVFFDQIIFENFNNFNSSIPFEGFQQIELSNSGQILCSAYGEGMVFIENDSVSIYTSMNSDLVSNAINVLHTYENELWIGTDDGLQLFDFDLINKLEENEFQSDLALIFNPLSNQYTLDTNEPHGTLMLVQIFGMDGKLTFKEAFLKRITLPHLKEGIYVVTCHNDDILWRKIIRF